MFTLIVLACLNGDCRNLVAQQPLLTEQQCATDFLMVQKNLAEKAPGVVVVGAQCINWKTGELTELK